LKKIRKAFSAKEIHRRIAALGAEIRSDAGDAPLVLLAILKGTAVFLADLMRCIEGNDVGFAFIQEVSDVSDHQTAHATEINFLNFVDLSGRNVYVLKDVVSTGVIENYLMTQLRQRGPANLKLVALLDRPAQRRVELTVDFAAFEVTDGVFVGYGLELEGRHGNLPYIGKV
jgi:hypoxanthine phosphoribosyltransferase